MYYLAYINNKEIIPINLNGVIQDEANSPNDLVSLIKFTNSFFKRSELLDYLKEKYLIPSEATELVYIIEKGKKLDKHYHIIPYGNQIYLADSLSFFNIDEVLRYLYANKYNVELVTILYAYYLKKYGYVEKIKNVFYNFKSNLSYYLDFLAKLYDKVDDANIKSQINYIREFIANELYLPVSSLAEKNYLRLEQLTEVLYSKIIANSQAFLGLYQLVIGVIDKPSVYSLIKLERIYQMTIRGCYYDDAGNPLIPEAYDEEILKFFKSVVYVFDSSTNSYKVENGALKVQKRNFVDLGMILYNYNDYQKNKKATLEDLDFEDSDTEEFLEPSDFKDYLDDPNDYGLKYHKRGYNE